MSKIENKHLLELEVERKFWKDPRLSPIFNLFVQGKDIPSIAEKLKMKPITVEGLITRKYFIKKLETHIRGVLFTTQVSKVIAASDIFSKLWERVTDNIEEIPPEICLKELTKMFPQKKEGMIVNPKNMNIFMDTLKGQPPEDLGKKLEEMEEDMGFEGLSEDDNAVYPELQESQGNSFEDSSQESESSKEDCNNKQEQNGEQQRDPEMDS